MVDVNALRLRYGKAYATVLPDGRVIPWKPLTIGRFIDYTLEVRKQAILEPVLENEIFRDCVLDPFFVNSMDDLPAGIVESVVVAIFLTSGPVSVHDINTKMEMKRMELTGILHTLVDMITLAFPHYAPEQVYNMDYETLMMRAAQAETRLIERKVLAQRVFFEDVDYSKPKENQEDNAPSPKASAEKLREAYFEQQKQAVTKETVISKAEVMAHNTVANTYEVMDADVQLNETAAIFYKDYLTQMKAGEKPQIKPLEQRVAETSAQITRAKAKYDKIEKKKTSNIEEKTKFYEEELAKQLEAKAKRRRK